MSSPNLSIDSPESLRAAILQLQEEHLHEGRMLKNQFNLTLDSIKPLNLIKGALSDMAQSTGISSFFPNHTPRHSGDNPSESLPEEPPYNTIKTLIGSLIVLGISSTVAKSSLLRRSLGRGLAHLLGKRQTNKPKELAERNGR